MKQIKNKKITLQELNSFPLTDEVVVIRDNEHYRYELWVYGLEKMGINTKVEFVEYFKNGNYVILGTCHNIKQKTKKGKYEWFANFKKTDFNSKDENLRKYKYATKS